MVVKLIEQFKKKTGNTTVATMIGDYTDAYVNWLEEQISKQQEQLNWKPCSCSKLIGHVGKMWHCDECNNTYSG